MKKIENFILPEHTNTLYENEAISSIFLTKEVADKINELVNAYNEFSTIDLKWKQTQEGIIRKGVVYMKDNLLNSLNDLMNTINATGYIDERIKKYCITLESQLNSLIGSVTEGSTTLDTEVIDARVGAMGETYDTTGNSIRAQFESLRAYVDEISYINKLDCGEIVKGYINSAGLVETSDQCLITNSFITPPTNFIINLHPDKHNIRVFRYDIDGTFEWEYPNAYYYKLEPNKKYKISFAMSIPENLTEYDIAKFSLMSYKETSVITPEMFGATPNNPEVDNAPYFYLMFEYLKSVAPIVEYENRLVSDFKQFTFKFNGVYYLDSGIYFPDMVNGIFDGLRVVNKDSFAGYLLNIGYARDCTFDKCYIDGNYNASCIQLLYSYSNCSIKNSTICHFSYYGIKTSGGGGHELNLVGNKIFQTEYQNFANKLNTISNGCALYLEPNDTDNLIADNVICYCCGSQIISIRSSSVMFNNNHIYNNSQGEIYIYETNGVYNGNFFDCITVHDARGGNFFNGNTFLSYGDFINYCLKFTTANYYGRSTYVANNMFKCDEGYTFTGDDESIIKSNNYEVSN